MIRRTPMGIETDNIAELEAMVQKFEEPQWGLKLDSATNRWKAFDEFEEPQWGLKL